MVSRKKDGQEGRCIMKIGIDLGGSHIQIGLVERGKVVQKREYNFKKEDN